MSTFESIIEVAAELESFFKENAYPMKNEPVLRHIRFLCSRLGAYDHSIDHAERKP